MVNIKLDAGLVISLFITLALGCLVFYISSPLLEAIFAGIIFSIAVFPIFRRWTRNRPRHRRWKAFVLTLGFALAFLLPVGIGVYQSVDVGLAELKQIQSKNPATNSTGLVKGWLDKHPSTHEWLNSIPVSDEKIVETVNKAISQIGAELGEIGENILTGIPGAILGGILVLASLFFSLVDGPRTLQKLKDNSLFSEQESSSIFSVFREASYSIVVASIVAGISQAVVLTVGSLILGKGSAILIGLVTFLCAFVPVIGTAPVTIFLTGYYFFMSDNRAAWGFLAFGSFAALIDNVIVPWIVGERTKIHPLVAFVSAIGGVEILGVYGLFIGPVATVTFFKIASLLRARSLGVQSASISPSLVSPLRGTPHKERPGKNATSL